jgi:hypothetical protein
MNVVRIPAIAKMTPTRVKIASFDHVGEAELDVVGSAMLVGDNEVGAARAARLKVRSITQVSYMLVSLKKRHTSDMRRHLVTGRNHNQILFMPLEIPI